MSRAVRASWRQQKGFGKRRTDWHRHALSTYTWMRTNRGPQKSWLHRLGKVADTECPCGHPVQDGDHLVFHCDSLNSQRRDLLGARRTWEARRSKLEKRRRRRQPLGHDRGVLRSHLHVVFLKFHRERSVVLLS